MQPAPGDLAIQVTQLTGRPLAARGEHTIEVGAETFALVLQLARSSADPAPAVGFVMAELHEQDWVAAWRALTMGMPRDDVLQVLRDSGPRELETIVATLSMT